MGKRIHEIGHVGRVVLSVGIESHYEINSESARVATKEFEPGFERRSPAPVLRMTDGHHVFSAGKNGGGPVARAVVYDEDLGKSGRNEPVDYVFETGGLVVRTNQESDVLLGGIRTVVVILCALGGKRKFRSFGSARVERHLPNETTGVFFVFFSLIEKQERKIRKENDAAVHEHVGAARNSEYAAYKVECLRNVSEEQKAAADSEEHEKMKGVEFLPFRNVERDYEYHDARNREEKLEKVHMPNLWFDAC